MDFGNFGDFSATNFTNTIAKTQQVASVAFQDAMAFQEVWKEPTEWFPWFQQHPYAKIVFLTVILLLILFGIMWAWGSHKLYQRWLIRDALYLPEQNGNKITHWGNPSTLEVAQYQGSGKFTFWHLPSSITTPHTIADSNFPLGNNNASVYRLWVFLGSANMKDNRPSAQQSIYSVPRMIFFRGASSNRATLSEKANDTTWYGSMNFGICVNRVNGEIFVKIRHHTGNTSSSTTRDDGSEPHPQFRPIVDSSDVVNYPSGTSFGMIPFQTWTHLTIQVNTGAIEGYVNGELLFSRTFSGNILPATGNGYLPLQIPTIGTRGYVCFFQYRTEWDTPSIVRKRYERELPEIKSWNEKHWNVNNRLMQAIGTTCTGTPSS